MWTISKTPSFKPGQRVRKRLIGQGFIHGTILEDPENSETRHVVAWDTGPVPKSIENPQRLMKAEDFVFSPTTAAQEPMVDDQWHTVPQYDHRNKAKFKPHDMVMTNLGPVEIIQSAITPLGQMYRVTDKFSGSTYDIFEHNIQGRFDPSMYYAQTA